MGQIEATGPNLATGSTLATSPTVTGPTVATGPIVVIGPTRQKYYMGRKKKLVFRFLYISGF